MCLFPSVGRPRDDERLRRGCYKNVALLALLCDDDVDDDALGREANLIYFWNKFDEFVVRRTRCSRLIKAAPTDDDVRGVGGAHIQKKI